jgi:hypothetical protein
MMVSKKAFASIVILLFLLIFLSITIQNKQNNLTDFIIIDQVETKKETEYLNFETILENTLNDCLDNPIIIKEKMIWSINKHIKNKNYFLKNKIDDKEETVTLLSLNEIIRINVYKPSKRIYIKEIHLTNGLFKNKQLGFKINTKNYQSMFLFSDKYYFRKVVFC